MSEPDQQPLPVDAPIDADHPAKMADEDAPLDYVSAFIEAGFQPLIAIEQVILRLAF